MLPAVVPEARIFTYDWDANYFENAPVQTLLGHADNLLALIATEQGPLPRPIIFVASCFGGLVLAEAINRAAQEGSPYRHVLFSTVGVIFLGTPFQGSDAARQAQWQVVVGGILGEQTSDHLVRDLEQKHHFVRQRVQKFTEIANADSFGNQTLFTFYSYDSCLDGFPRQGLFDVTHSGMNKFDCPENPGFKLVRDTIRRFVNNAPGILELRKPNTQHRHFHVPFGRNEDFVGRDSILKQLLERIPPSANKDDCQRTAVEGLGGVGKTQVALEAAYRVRDEHPTCSVFWVPAVDSISFEMAYREIGKALGVQGLDDDKADVKSLVKAALSCDSAGGLKENQISDAESTARLVKFLANLPLAIKQASAYMAKTGISTTKYLNYCQSSNKTMAKLLSKDFEDRGRYREMNNPIATTWLISFNYISRDMPLAARYLKYICFLAEKDIPISLLPSGEDELEEDEKEKDEEEEDELEKDEAIGVLKGYAFILERKNPDAFDIHRLIAITLFSHVATSCFLLGKYDEAEQMYRQTLELKKSMLDREHPDTLTSMDNLALVLYREGKYEEAERMHRQTLELKEKVLGKTHPDTLASMNNIALILDSQGKFEEAEQMHREVLEIREAVLDREHPDTLTTMNNLANVLNNQGKHEEAERMLRQTLKLSQKVLDNNHPDIIASMTNLALVLDSQGKYEEAEQMHRQTLELSKKVRGREHPDTLNCMDNLAIVLDKQGKQEEAEEMCRQTIKLKKTVLWENHPDILTSMNILAIVLFNKGKYEEAEQMHRQTLERRSTVLGEKNPDTFDSINNLANVLSTQGKHEEAELMQRRLLDLSQKNFGRNHPDTLTSMNNLANVLRSQGKYEEAEQKCRQALELFQAVLGREHPLTLISMNNLASLLDSQKKYEEAEHMHRQTLALRQAVLGNEHPDTLGSMNNLANVLRSQGNHDEAEQVHRQELELREAILGSGHLDTLALVLGSQGKHEEAEQMHEDSPTEEL
ncbi:hypothetical protein DL764_007723 [Monosporascus ibericus]|uniref:Uncharacterized protein n=1 Tax=Monosporascus ibericus TaxID=155417 RepID=A0A4Q4SZA9_9PEZI|nr:hypothetical protein DL764_007723 [Monosporascus ibericus]